VTCEKSSKSIGISQILIKENKERFLRREEGKGTTLIFRKSKISIAFKWESLLVEKSRHHLQLINLVNGYSQAIQLKQLAKLLFMEEMDLHKLSVFQQMIRLLLHWITELQFNLKGNLIITQLVVFLKC
jgi:hypothetical protein